MWNIFQILTNFATFPEISKISIGNPIEIFGNVRTSSKIPENLYFFRKYFTFFSLFEMDFLWTFKKFDVP